MNFWTRIYKPAMVALAILLFFGAGQMQWRLDTDRKEMGLTRVDPLTNAPPVLAFTTVALGSFRGLIANALWMRLSDLQLDDKYFEMEQLGDWITKLQPHMVPVWRFLAWNMAYNISVKFKNHEDRWHWVQRGIELLRDQGLEYNPHETGMYHDLSWIYQHKIGMYLDDAHMLYKLRLAQEMQEFFPTGRPDFKVLLNPTTPEEKELVRKLEDVEKLDPKMIQKVDEDYGPFDWRLPDAYGVYWAEMGRLYGRKEEQETLRRSIYQTLRMTMFRGGALDKSVTNVTSTNFMLWPNLDQIPTISHAYEQMIAEETNNPQGLEKNMEGAHKNFLKESIWNLYMDGRENDARHWFNYLTNLYTNAFLAEGTNITLDQFAISNIIQNYNETDMNQVNAILQGMYRREFYCVVRENYGEAENYKNLIHLIWTHYYKKTGQASQERVGLKPLAELQQFVLKQELDPTNGMPPWARERLITHLGLPASGLAPPATNAVPAEASGH